MVQPGPPRDASAVNSLSAGPRPPAVVVSGAPASGKSVLGAAVARVLPAVLLDLDVVTGPLTALVARLLGAGGDLGDARVRTLARRARYDTLADAAVCNLRLGVSVVLVAPFTRERSDPRAWAELRDALAAAGGAPRLIWLRCPGSEVLRRMRARAAARDRATLADPQAFLSGPGLLPPVVPHVAVDATSSLQRQTAAILGSLPLGGHGGHGDRGDHADHDQHGDSPPATSVRR